MSEARDLAFFYNGVEMTNATSDYLLIPKRRFLLKCEKSF